ncbi:hypothetical protein Ancab_009127 [Ancistrocladus abbreviatus]
MATADGHAETQKLVHILCSLMITVDVENDDDIREADGTETQPEVFDMAARVLPWRLTALDV